MNIRLLKVYCIFLTLHLIVTGPCIAAQVINTLTEVNESESLSETVQVFDGRFLVMMNNLGEKRVINYGLHQDVTPTVKSNNFITETQEIVAAESAFLPQRLLAYSSTTILKTESSDYQQGTVGEILGEALEVQIVDDLNQPLLNQQLVFEIRKGGGSFSDGSDTLLVTTDSNGVASVELLLGTSTGDNPVGWLEDGLKTQQVGLNVVDCYLQSNPSQIVSFYAYGFPDIPGEILIHKEIFNSSLYVWEVLGFAGEVFVSVIDQYQNPISNVPITITAADPIALSSVCSYPNADNRPAMIVPISERADQPPPFAYEQYTGYAGQAQTLTSNYLPSLFQIYAGGTPNAQYNITLSASGLNATHYIRTASRKYNVGNCDGTEPPESTTWLYAFGSGQHKAGDVIDLYFWLYEKKEKDLVQSQCGGCEDIIGKAEYYTDMTLRDVSFTVNGQDIAGTSSAYGNVFAIQTAVPENTGYLNLSANYTRDGRSRTSQSGDCYCTSTEDVAENIAYNVSLSPLVISLDPSIVIPVDEYGINLCDFEIPYTIEPANTTPETMSLTIFEDGVPFHIVPLDKDTLAPAEIDSGLQFDLTKTYTASITINGYDLGRYNGTTSNEMVLSLDDSISVDEIYVENEKENIPVMQGKSATFHAVANPANLSDDLEWSVYLPHEENSGEDQILVRMDKDTGVLTVDVGSGSGEVIVRASYSDCIYLERVVPIGCQTCKSGTCNVEGGSKLSLSSVDFSISLGKTIGGHRAGELAIRANDISSYLYSPKGLAYTSLVRTNEVIRDEEGALRQIVTGKTFVDIVTDSDNEYSVNFYRLATKGSKVDGVYTLIGGSSPFVSYQLSNPDTSPDSGRLKISEIKDQSIKESEYIQNKATGTWSLSRGSGAIIQSRTEQLAGDLTIKKEQIESADGSVSTVTERSYKEFAWGQGITSKAEDPDGANLQTQYSYYEDEADEGSYSKLESVTYPTGSWEYYTYDSLGRISTKYSSWLDLNISEKESAELTTYNYDPSTLGTADEDLNKDKYKPRVVTVSLGGIITLREYYAFGLNDAEERVEIYEKAASQSAQFGDIGNQRTVTTYYSENLSTIEAGLVKTIVSYDGQVSSYEYESGSYDSSSQSFSSGAGDAQQLTITHTTEDSPTGIAYKTTRDIQISDEFGNLVSQETQVYNGSDYLTIRWQTTDYDDFGRSIGTTSSNGTTTEQTWSCCGKETETDATGVTSRYEYDDLNRVEYIFRDSLTGEIVSHYNYDASGRQTESTTSAQTLTLSSESTYDKAGRITTSTDSRDLTTTYTYENGGLITTVTQPGGATEITEIYSDGRTKSITGTGVVPQYYSYGVNSDGTRYTTVTTGSETSTSQNKTTTDFLGRTAQVAHTGFTGIETTTYYLNNKGLLIKTSSPEIADTLYEYNELGEQTRSGLDLNGNGSLDSASDDRINGTATSYQFDGDSWWQTSEQSIFPESGVANNKVISRAKVRLSGFDFGLIGETISTDIHGNQTSTKRYLDKSNHKITEITDHPESDPDATTTYRFGLVTSTTDRTGISTSYSYDALGRKTGSTDPRTGLHVIHYNEQGEVDYTEDPASNRTLFTYDLSTGRRSSTTDAKDRTTYFLYDDLGNMTHTWGATYPIRYEYDSHGRMTTMHTYQTTEGWDSSAWPVANDVLSKETHWHYHEASGLLESKEDAESNLTSYTYFPGGKLHQRTWARQADSADLTTIYSYDEGTGQLTGIDYSDTTADISFSYNRTGSKSSIVDGVGTRTFSYTANLQPETETLSGLLNYTLTRSYAGTGVPGRYTGLNLDSDYVVGYGYDNSGRFDSVSWDVGGATDSVRYGYLTNSHLLNGVTFNSGVTTTYGYEPSRNVKTEVLSTYNTTTISKYSYEYDEIGRRTSMTTEGEIFDTPPIPISPETALAETLVTYQPDNLNQYSEIDDNGTTINPLHDNDGNLIADDSYTYSWNGENRLITLTPKVPTINGDKQLSFQYDYQGRRFSKTISTWNGSNWQEEDIILYIYDGWNLIQELDNSGTPTANYVHGLDLSQTIQGAGGVGGILARIDQNAGITHAYLYDVNGNVGQMVNTTDGSIAAHYEYDPFGKLITSAGGFADANPFLFSSKYLDVESGLYYYGYRFYDTSQGRWLNRDPIQEDGGLNLYGFSQNEPINFFDYLGRKVYWAGRDLKRPVIFGNHHTMVVIPVLPD